MKHTPGPWEIGRIEAEKVATVPELLDACRSLILELPDWALDESAECIGNANVKCIKYRRDNLKIAIAKAEGWET